ncbi:MAG TPA: SBBP repeat-containing protein [Terriglobia bacterium]|nr:SBBP repeat-containing protein [Terriglobia bacterium]
MAHVQGVGELPGKSNYFIGNDPARWRTDIPNYAQVRYRGVYPGVDLVYYGHQGQLEYDFLLEPDVDPGQLRVEIEGAKSLKISEAGNLVLETASGQVMLKRPEAYQGSGMSRRSVKVSYVLRGGEIGFRLGKYRRDRTLTIDPVLTYSTYLGGSGGDVGYGVGVDSAGNTYVAGVTSSTNFPILSAIQSSSGGNGDAFVTKLNPGGTALLYSTYLGGSGSDTASAVAADSKGDVFVTGQTNSSNFPIAPKSSANSTTTVTPFQASYAGSGDAFVAELPSTGNALTYSSYLGGSGADSGQAIAVDASGNAYVTGSTQSPDFPIPTGTTPYQPTLMGSSDAFVTEVNFSGTALLYSTYLGGTQADTGQGIAVDSAGNAYVAGYTFSTDFPVMNPIQGTNAGNADAFVSEVNPTGGALLFSTYYGGSQQDRAFGLALDGSANIYVVGNTQSSDFPTTTGVFQPNSKYAGNGDAFAFKFNSGGTSVSYSTLIGGSGVDQANGVAVDSKGDAAVVGFTSSSDFPTVSPFQSILGLSGGGSCGGSPCSDAFVTQLNPTGTQALLSSFLGGSGADFGQGIAVDSSGNLYVTGSTSSSNFPAVAGDYQTDLAGVAGNAFVTEIGSGNSPAIVLSPAKVDFGNEAVSVASTVQTVTVFNLGTAPLTISAVEAPSSDFTDSNNCVGTVAPAGGSCTINVTFTPQSTGAVTDQFTITDNAANSPHTLTVTGTGVTQASAVTVAPTSLTFPNTQVSSVSQPQTVTITNTGTSTLDITGITVTGDFKQTNTCAAVFNALSVGQSCSVSVEFAPAASGSRTGTLTISDNATGSPQGVSLSGTGLALFSLASSSSTVATIVGSSSTTFTVSASAVNGFTGNISLSCATSVSCSFSPTTIFAGQSSTLTISGLSASTPNPFNFTVTGTSGSQTATVNLTVLLESFSLSGTPALNTVVAGAPANYTILVTPLFGFNQQVNLSCSGLPSGSTCNFANASVTPNGKSPASVALTISTTQSASLWRWWPGGRGPRFTPLPGLIAAVCLSLLLALLAMRRLWPGAALPRRLAGWPVMLALMLLSLMFLGACRGVYATAPTPTGNYIITITGTLNSNNTVQESTTVDLAIT